MVYVWRVSFDNFSLTSPDKRAFIGLGNFLELLSNQQFLFALGRSTYFSFMSTALSFIVGFIIALSLHSRFAMAKSFFQSIFVIPMVLTPYVIGQTWRFLVDFGYGPIQYMLNLIGLPKVNFLGESILALHTTILVDVWQWTPFVILIMYAGLSSLPQEPLEAARVDGASRWQEFWFVTIPLLRTSISAVLLIRIMDSFREFDKVFALTAGGPGTSTEVLSLYIYRTGFQYFHMGKAAAMSLVMLFFIIFISNYYIKKTGIIKYE
jgi:multiple sugar transport system permease protein